jgi:hypothetical protein
MISVETYMKDNEPSVPEISRQTLGEFMKRLFQLLPLGALILLPVKGVQAETPEDPIYIKTSNGWNGAYAHGNE